MIFLDGDSPPKAANREQIYNVGCQGGVALKYINDAIMIQDQTLQMLHLLNPNLCKMCVIFLLKGTYHEHLTFSMLKCYNRVPGASQKT